MWIVRLALRRPYTIAVLSFVTLLLGSLVTLRMRSDVFPTIDIPVVIAVWSYQGMPAEEMERRIVTIAERASSATVDGIARMESQTINGIGLIKFYFQPDTDVGAAIAQIASVSQTASRFMPPGVQPPMLLRYNASNVPVAQLTVSSEKQSEQALFDYGNNFLRMRLFTIPGLATPAPYGGKTRQVMVDVDPAAVTARGISPQDVVGALVQSNVIVPAGAARMGGNDLDVMMNNSPSSIDEFKRIPITVAGGAPLFLGDVAEVHDGFATQQNIVRVDGHRATYLTILKKANASTIAVVDAAREMLPAIRAAAPEGTELKLEFDQSIFVRATMRGVVREAVISSLLVSTLILVFLGSWRSMLIVSLSIPLSILVSLLGLYATGQTLNLMTLGGLTLAIGMLVDDATVAIENIHRVRAEGKPLAAAVVLGAQQIAKPALAATLTICIVFFPVVLLTGPAKYLFVPLALAVVFAMLGSYAVSRTVVLTLAERLLRGEHAHAAEGGHGWWARAQAAREASLGRLQRAYAGALAAVLRHRRVTLAVFVGCVATTGLLTRVVGMDFFPEVDAGQMRLHVRAPVGTRIEETEKTVERVERVVHDVVPARDLEAVDANIGVPTFFNLAFVPSDNVGGQDAEILIALKPEHAPTALYRRRLREALAASLPGVHVYFQAADIVSQVLNFGLPAPVDVEIEGRDLAKSAELARALRDRMRTIPGIVDVRVPQAFDHPALELEVDRERAAQVGLTQRDVATSVLTSLSSSNLVAPSFWVNPKNGVSYSVAVQTPIEKAESVDALLGIPVTGGARPIRAGDDRAAPSAPGIAPYLGAVARVRPALSMPLITHESAQRVVEVQAGVEGRDLGSVAAEVRAAIAALGALPPGTSVHLRGQSESMTTSFASLGLGLVLAAILVYLLMAILFQSWIDPLIIMSAVPGALAGVLWMLALTHTTLNVESFMGAIMAVGVAVSNSILVVHQANDLRASGAGGALEAALEAGKTRLRPVLMTAIAMIVGMLPMALALGEAGEQNAPLGRAVIGGLLVATATTLFLVPLLYTLLRRAAPASRAPDAHLDVALEEARS